MRSILTPVLALAVTTSCIAVNGRPAAVDPEPGAVAFELAGPGGAALVIPVGINGRGPYRFVLDTGATLTCVDERLVKELELRDAAGVVAFGGTIRGTGQMRVVRLDSVEVGAAKATRLSGCVVNLQPMAEAGVKIDGLLGLNFLKSYRVTIDFHARTVRLDPGDGTSATPSQ
jgi:predicted aspartyl protease